MDDGKRGREASRQKERLRGDDCSPVPGTRAGQRHEVKDTGDRFSPAEAEAVHFWEGLSGAPTLGKNPTVPSQ